MNRWRRWCATRSQERLIARFGAGRLVRCEGVRYVLRGGTPSDLAAAREWAAHFMHEAFIERTHSIRRNTDARDGESLRNRQ
jgi:hypothetical protein